MRNHIYIINNISIFNKDPKSLHLNIGKILSEEYDKNKNIFLRKINIDSAAYFKKLLNNNINSNISNLLFSNIGILQEPEFCLNVQHFLLDYAINYEFFLWWPYPIDFEEGTLNWGKNSIRNNIKFEPNVLNKKGDLYEL